MAGVGFQDIVRTLKVRLFTAKVIKSHVKLQVKSNATKIPRESTAYSTIKNFSACHNTLRGIKLATSQANCLCSACSLAITLYQTHIVLCPGQVWGARPKKGFPLQNILLWNWSKPFTKAFLNLCLGRELKHFLGHCPVLSYMVSTEMTRYWTNSFIVWWKNRIVL